MMKKPPIILITTDQHRFDALGCNGNTQIRTPHIDALACDGVNFTNAIVQNTVCIPSRACLQTGRYTHQHGVTYMEQEIDTTPGLPPWEKTFMEHMQDNGYCTAATGKIHMYPEKGFHYHDLTGGKGMRWTQSTGQPIGPAPLGPNYAAWLEKKRPGAYEEIYKARRAQPDYKRAGLLENPLSNDEYVETWIAERSMDIIREHADEPFFLWCGFCGPHDPWDPPEPYRSMYHPEDMTLPDEYPGWKSWRERWDEATLRKMRAYYWGMVTCIDDHIGNIIAQLKQLTIYDDALIIFTTDHGEFMGERARTGKGLFYESIIRVPFIVKPPRPLGKALGTIPDVVENFRLAPTILDYAGVVPPASMTATTLRGAVETGTAGDMPAFSEFVSHDKKTIGKCVRTRAHKYIVWQPDGREEMYGLVNDPMEKENIAGGADFDTRSLQESLHAWMSRTEWRWNY